MSVLSSKARAVTHARRQEIASKILKDGDPDVSGVFSLLLEWQSGELEPEELRRELVALLNEQIDVPVVEESTERQMLEGIVQAVETLLVDLSEEGHLPAIAEELLTGELRPEELDERLAAAMADALDVPLVPESVEEEMIFDRAISIGRSLIARMVAP